MLQQLLDWLAGTPRETALRLAEVKPGRIAVEGKLHSAEPVMAPIGKSRCAGYFYHSTYLVGSRMRGYIRRRLRDALVYGPALSIELEGGSLPVEPLQKDSWSDQHHLEMLRYGYEGFEASEKLIRQGSRVKVIGRVVRSPAGGLVLRFSELYLQDDKPASSGKAKDAPLRKGFRKAQRKAQRKG